MMVYNVDNQILALLFGASSEPKITSVSFVRQPIVIRNWGPTPLYYWIPGKEQDDLKISVGYETFLDFTRHRREIKKEKGRSKRLRQ